MICVKCNSEYHQDSDDNYVKKQKQTQKKSSDVKSNQISKTTTSLTESQRKSSKVEPVKTAKTVSNEVSPVPRPTAAVRVSTRPNQSQGGVVTPDPDPLLTETTQLLNAKLRWCNARLGSLLTSDPSSPALAGELNDVRACAEVTALMQSLATTLGAVRQLQSSSASESSP